MTRSPAIRLPVLLAFVVLAAGCLSGGPGAGTPTATATPDTPTATDTPDTPTTTPEGVTVEYVVRAGEIPDEFESVTVTVQAVFVERPADLGPCYPEVYSGPFKPTITPLPTPGGDCHRSEPVDVDLAELEGDYTLNATAPASAQGHALIVTEVTATRQNGTAVTGIKGLGGAELLASQTRPEGRYGVTIGIGPADSGASYDYWLLYERFDPAD